MDRYSRQILLKQFGEKGQRKLGKSVVLVIGCGALGSYLSTTMVRAGIGKLVIVDRDVVELNNLQRQILYNEDDVANKLPKAKAAARTLSRINSSIKIEGLVMDVTPKTVEGLIQNMDIVLDGTDNFETRYLVNDACVKHGIPWIYAGIVNTYGMTMTIPAGGKPCLRCVFPHPPPAGSSPTCDTDGVLNTAVSFITSIQATESFKVLLGSKDVHNSLITFDIWNNLYKSSTISPDKNCHTCNGKFDFLNKTKMSWVTTLCGRDSVQITPAGETTINLETLRKKLENVGEVSFNGLLLHLVVGNHELTIFPDGRTIVKGTTNEITAKNLYSKYIGF